MAVRARSRSLERVPSLGEVRAEADALRRTEGALRASLTTAANAGKALLAARVRLEEENEALRAALAEKRPEGHGGDAEADRAATLAARVAALREQLGEAERENARLASELARTEEQLRRNQGSERLSGAATTSRVSGGRRGGAAEAAAGDGVDELASTTQMLRAAEARERRLLASVRAAEDTAAHAENRLGALSNEMADLRAAVAAATRARAAAEEEADRWRNAAERGREEFEAGRRELEALRRAVRRLADERDLPADVSALQAAGDGGASHGRNFADSVAAERERAREAEEARRALVQIRARTQEAQAVREQVDVVVAENNRLRAALAAAEAARDAEARKRADAEVALEVLRERAPRT